MHAVDLQNIMNEYLNDKSKKIEEDKLNNICKCYKKDKTCKYIGLTPYGFVCVKNTPLKKVLDDRSDKDLMVAKGNNCKGL